MNLILGGIIMKNTMTLDELIIELQRFKEKHGGNTKVIFDVDAEVREYPIMNILESYDKDGLRTIKLTDFED